MADTETQVIETTAGQIASELVQRGISEQRSVTVMIEPDDWLAKARREARGRIVAAGLSDEDIDQLIKEARSEI